ncbi:MAG: aspartate--tRNA ligase [Porphyromonas sp.]|uniref:aspartate--tRNA ligase n=1 Tax=Porphyromonas sp. TaxID=1924944 RepID=UPI002A761360|nr:aspartate--tRNA ligase [Porphyromonas sp.]MDD6928981.1 aspartate--tRNA ligase [Bacteroidales bacterium]MDY3111194.1 aspartate--tRNA ligase [Porphyromonas sp.]
MYRTHTCGALRASDEGQQVTLAGWVAKIRRMGAMTFLDLRDRYGITQIFFDESHQGLLSEVGREWVLAVTGAVRLRSSVNEKIPTGQIEILADRMEVLNRADTPPFTIEDVSDGGDDLRMKYRYLDLRRRPVLSNIELRHRMTMETRRYLDGLHFLEIETPMLIGSTPEGARDFVVPSRMNPGQFYALPQSPQTFKQLLMVAGMDRYFQIVKCFRDEDLRADRQPEFTQIDCEMSFVEQDDILSTFEGLAKHLFKEIRGIDLPTPLRRMTWYEAMDRYGSDKPDLRFGMEIAEVTETIQGHGFGVVDDAKYIGAIVVTGKADYTRKQIDQLTDFVKRPQVGAKGLLWLRYQPDGTMKSSFDKFLDADQLKALADKLSMQPGDIAFLISGDKRPAQKQLGTLRLHIASELGLMQPGRYECLWVVDFPLLEWDEETQRYYAMHHPFTAPKPEDQDRLESDPGSVRADAYDMVINGVEVGGGSIRIHDAELQARVFATLGFTKERAEEQFGFLMNAFKYGAPPHGGIAFGLDRWVSLMAELDSIRDCIAFPKNNSGRDVMIDAPARLDPEQLDELHLKVRETL